VMYGSNFSEDVCSNTSPTAAANAIIRKLFPNNEKTLMSGIHLFGIHLETLKQARESKRESNSNIQLKQIKPIEHCGKSMIYKRQRKFGDQLKEQVQIEGAKIYGKDQVILKQISYNVKYMGFQIAYGSKDDREKEKKLNSIVQVIDQNYMSREGYRALAAVEPDLEREWIVSEQRLKITKNMNQKIEITLINIPIIPTLDELDF
ncbi:9451_t:CDS:2, partial [Rhizophagus irregularis]